MEPDLPLQNFRNVFLQSLPAKIKKWFLLLVVCFIVLISLATVFLLPQALKKPIPLPVKTTPKQINYTLPSFDTYQGSLVCPSIPQFCKEGKDIFIRGSYAGFGAKLPANTPIYAVFDGELTAKQTNLPLAQLSKETQPMISTSLADNKNHLLAYYYFSGKLPKNGLVKTGQIIAISSGEPLKLYNQSSLVFMLFGRDTATGEGKLKTSKNNYK